MFSTSLELSPSNILAITQWLSLIFPHIGIEYYLLMLTQAAYIVMAGGNGLAASVLAGPVFLKVKIKIYLYKSSSVIFGLIRVIILSYNG